jgi:neutral ceramidase
MRHELCILSLLFLAPLSAEGLKAGATRVDITPPIGLHLMGFADRTAPATGVLDPLHARILVLETPEERLAIVTLDVCRAFGPWWINALRAQVKISSGITHVLVVASHTHSAPEIADDENTSSSWERETLAKVSKAILAAHQQAVEAQLGIGYGAADVGYNRRKIRANGTVEMIWENPDKKPMGPVDARVAILRIDDKQGRPIAILINHALHPVVFGVRGLSYSADFVGPLTATVESSFGGAAVCLFVQGACGDINPYHADVPPDQDPVGKRDWTAGVIAKEALRVAKAIHTSVPEHPLLQVTEDTLIFHGRWTAAAKTDFRLPVSAVLIDRQIALVSMPGEPFVEFQTRWRERCPVTDCLFAGYTNGYFGYFPTIRAAAEGGYGASDDETWIEPGAPDRMLDQATIRIYQMLNYLRPDPQPYVAPPADPASPR